MCWRRGATLASVCWLVQGPHGLRLLTYCCPGYGLLVVFLSYFGRGKWVRKEA